MTARNPVLDAMVLATHARAAAEVRGAARPMTSGELENRLVWLELDPREDAKRLLREERLALQEALQSGDRERIEAAHASAEKVLRATARLWGLAGWEAGD